jgi:hypothetical protein
MGTFVVGYRAAALLWSLTLLVIGINIYTVLNFFFVENKASVLNLIAEDWQPSCEAF